MMKFEKELALFKEFCDIPALSDEDISDKWKQVLQQKIYDAFVASKDDPLTYDSAEAVVRESIDDLKAWIDTKENYETFKKNKELG